MIRWTALVLVLLPLAAPAQDGGAESRGRMLYGNHCGACHGTQMHWRDGKLATDWASLKAQVRRWQAAAQLNWSEDDIDDVARFLNDSFYRFAGGKVAWAQR
jgi:mono/diheme cytochrome c family protein